MVGLQIQLVLGRLSHRAQVRAESRFGDRLGVVAVVLWPLHERPRGLGWNDARLVPELAHGARDEGGAQTRLHPDDAGR
jgi:hypothetical protein